MPGAAKPLFAMVPFTALDDEKFRELTPAAQMVYVWLCGHYNAETGWCNPTRRTLAGGTGHQVETVSRALSDLKDAGFIVIRVYNEVPCRQTYEIPHLKRLQDELGTGERMKRRRRRST